MGFWTTFYALSFYVATLILILGVGYKIYQYTKTLRMLLEVILFKSLFRSNKWIWLFAMIFHGALWVILLRHLRYFIDPQWVIYPIWELVELIQPFGKYASFAMISSASDYLMLVLLLVIGVSGVLMSFVTRTDIVQFKAFMLSVISFQWQNFELSAYQMPPDSMLLVHLAAVILLMIVFPFSKLLHAPGVFFSPGRNQVDNAREKRHVAPWAIKQFEAPQT